MKTEAKARPGISSSRTSKPVLKEWQAPVPFELPFLTKLRLVSGPVFYHLLNFPPPQENKPPPPPGAPPITLRRVSTRFLVPTTQPFSMTKSLVTSP